MTIGTITKELLDEVRELIEAYGPAIEAELAEQDGPDVDDILCRIDKAYAQVIESVFGCSDKEDFGEPPLVLLTVIAAVVQAERS